MDHYIDIRVLPDPEFKETVLMNALYAKLHRVLIPAGKGWIGLSFPNHEKTLGDVMRIHGDQQGIDKLLTEPWLQGLRSYTQVGSVLAVPTNCKYRTVCRRQAKSAYNKRKRAVSKGWLSVEEALEKFPDGSESRLDLPFAQLKSVSKNTTMRVYIDHGDLIDSPTPGNFSSYGLSKTTTIPWF